MALDKAAVACVLLAVNQGPHRPDMTRLHQPGGGDPPPH